MIELQMDLNKWGLGERSQLVRMTITNDGTNRNGKGNYKYAIYGKNDRKMKTGFIKDWDRLGKHSILLLQAVINDAYPKGAVEYIEDDISPKMDSEIFMKQLSECSAAYGK